MISHGDPSVSISCPHTLTTVTQLPLLRPTSGLSLFQLHSPLFLLAMPIACGTRDQSPAVEARSLNHWATRKIPCSPFCVLISVWTIFVVSLPWPPLASTSSSFTDLFMLQYSWASFVAQLVKNLPAMWEAWTWSLGWDESLEKGKDIHSSILAWRIPRTI